VVESLIQVAPLESERPWRPQAPVSIEDQLLQVSVAWVALVPSL